MGWRGSSEFRRRCGVACISCLECLIELVHNVLVSLTYTPQWWMQWADAIEMYRSAMSTWQEHTPELECDFTQRIHTMEGLAELLQAGHCPLSRSVSDCKLMEEVCGGLRCVCMWEWTIVG